MADTLLHLVVSPKLEDTLIDWLLAQPQQLVFETSRVQQYGRALDSLTERVTGFRTQVLFAVPIQADTWHVLLPGLEQLLDKEAFSYRLLNISSD